MTDAELLSAAIDASGLSVRAFQRKHLPTRNARSVFRWLKGRNRPEGEPTIPDDVRNLCRAILDVTRQTRLARANAPP